MNPEAILRELSRCGSWLDAAIRRSEGETGAQEVVAEVLANRAQLWAGERSCMVTQMHTEPGKSWIFVWLGGGDLAELLAMRPAIESWGMQQGASEARINGRLGWARVLKRHGFNPCDGELVKVF